MKKLPLIIAFGCGVLAVILVLSTPSPEGITGNLIMNTPQAAGSSFMGLLVLLLICAFSTAVIYHVQQRDPQGRKF